MAKESLQYSLLKNVNLLSFRDKKIRNIVIKDIKDFSSFAKKEYGINSIEKISDPEALIKEYAENLVKQNCTFHMAKNKIHAICKAFNMKNKDIYISGKEG